MLPALRSVYLRKKGRSDADATKIIWVDPNAITYETLTKIGHRLNDPGAVYYGRWDKARAKFHHRYKVQSLRRHFIDDVPWPETEYYERKRTVVSTKGYRGCSSEEELLAFLNRLDTLYERIKEDGYKTQKELLEECPERTRKLNNDAPTPELNEIGINIGRDGELLWQYGGQHRLCIAQLLKLDEVPVQVLTRHGRWQERRDKLVDNLGKTSATPYLDHPDMQDIVDEYESDPIGR